MDSQIPSQMAFSREEVVIPLTHWENPERQDMPFSPFVLRVLPVNGHFKVSIGVLFIKSKYTNPTRGILDFCKQKFCRPLPYSQQDD